MTNKTFSAACILSAALMLPLSGCALFRSTASSGDASEQTTGEGAPAQTTTVDDAATQESSAATVQVAASSSETAINLVDVNAYFSARDLDPTYKASDATTITLADTGAHASGTNASKVSIEGSTITITGEGVYVIEGSLSDGQVVVNAANTDKVQLVLQGASINSSHATALYVANADKVFVTLAAGSNNTLSATGADETVDEHTVDAAIFACDDVTFNGSGSLRVSSAAGHAIAGKDEVTICGGTVELTAARHGVQANDSVAMAAGDWSITAGTDGIHAAKDGDTTKGVVLLAAGSLNIQAASDGVDAASYLQVDDAALTIAAGDDGLHSESDLVINGGSVTISQSYEGLEGARVSVTGGDVSVVASDDGINATGDNDNTTTSTTNTMGGFGGGPGMGGGMDEYVSSATILISGGTISVNATGDGIDSNGDVTVRGGTCVVSGPTNNGNGALDYNGTATVSGGTFVAAGSMGMAQGFSANSSQVSALLALSGQAGDTLSLQDDTGATLLQTMLDKSYECVLISCPELAQGQSYTLSSSSAQISFTPDTQSYSTVNTMMGGMQGMGMMQPGGDGMRPDGMRPGGDGMQPGGGMHPDGMRPDGAPAN